MYTHLVPLQLFPCVTTCAICLFVGVARRYGGFRHIKPESDPPPQMPATRHPATATPPGWAGRPRSRFFIVRYFQGSLFRRWFHNHSPWWGNGRCLWPLALGVNITPPLGPATLVLVRRGWGIKGLLLLRVIWQWQLLLLLLVGCLAHLQQSWILNIDLLVRSSVIERYY